MINIYFQNSKITLSDKLGMQMIEFFPVYFK